jgi:Na+-driven multidrug efflux pump
MAAIGPASSLMMMRGLHRRVVSLSAPIVVLNGVLNATLAFLLGAAGAAIATTAANASQNALFRATVQRHLRVTEAS